jgi:hypothetical protein
LHGEQGRTESQQPDRKLRPDLSTPEFDAGRAQAETALLRKNAEHEPDQQADQDRNLPAAKSIKPVLDAHIFLLELE